MADYINKWNVNGVYYNIQDHDRGLPGGVATLDLNGRIPIAQLPETSINYRGTWDASTNTPTLADGTGTQGDMYFISTSGTWKGEQWYIGDRVIYNGTVWQRVPSSGVNSVNGKDGEVVLYGTDINMSPNEATTIEAKINGLNATNPTASGTAEVAVTDITQTKGQLSATRKNLPTVSSPTASGSALAFIDTVSQRKGKLSATKKNIQDSSTTQKGVVQLTSSYTSTDEAKATNGKALAAMLTTLKVDDPTASGTATEVITNISQTNGKIKATKKLLPSGKTLSVSTKYPGVECLCFAHASAFRSSSGMVSVTINGGTLLQGTRTKQEGSGSGGSEVSTECICWASSALSTSSDGGTVRSQDYQYVYLKDS